MTATSETSRQALKPTNKALTVTRNTTKLLSAARAHMAKIHNMKGTFLSVTGPATGQADFASARSSSRGARAQPTDLAATFPATAPRPIHTCGDAPRGIKKRHLKNHKWKHIENKNHKDITKISKNEPVSVMFIFLLFSF